MSDSTSDIGTIIAWAGKAKAIYVPVNGSGGASVKVDKKDFIAMFAELESFDAHVTKHFNGNLYLGG